MTSLQLAMMMEVTKDDRYRPVRVMLDELCVVFPNLMIFVTNHGFNIDIALPHNDLHTIRLAHQKRNCSVCVVTQRERLAEIVAALHAVRPAYDPE